MYDTLSILNRYWGYNSFRGIQQEIIDNICAGNDTLGLMPTGGGKSITFQVPALAIPGVCIVITPLVSLMKDQVQHLKERGISAAYIHAELKREDIIVILENCIFGSTKLLYVSPERLSSELFISKLRHMNVSFITVDEAHCISQWGHDFRPSYLQINTVREIIPDVPILALTATATPQVCDDIQDSLHFRKRNVISMSFVRPNIIYSVLRTYSLWESIKQLLTQNIGSAIIYATTRQQCVELTEHLTQEGFNATFFHAGLKDAEKTKRQEAWQRDEIRIIVATNAFGMGIDKPDVRLVLHAEAPDSIEAYFQEAGRAGRDGKMAKAILLVNDKSEKILRAKLASSFPPKKTVREIYTKICYYLQIGIGSGLNVTREFNYHEFCINFKYYTTTVASSLRLLDAAGYIDYNSEDSNTSRIQIIATKRELYHVIQNLYEPLFEYLLRRYHGIFMEPTYIDENSISLAIGMSQDDIYKCFIHLSSIKVIKYIPRRSLPLITFKTQRLETDQIILSPDVYEKRQQQLKTQIENVIDYMTQTDICRSKYLLRYFGEKDSKDCGKCDICYQEEITEEIYEQIHSEIIEILKNGRIEPVRLKLYQFKQEHVAFTLQKMLEQKDIILRNGYIYQKTTL